MIIKYSKDYNTIDSVGTIIYGHNGSGKTTLLKHIQEQYDKANAETVFVDSKYLGHRDSKIQIGKFKKEFMNRFNLLEKERVSHYSKLSIKLKPRILLIDDIDFLLSHYKDEINEICYYLGMLLRMGSSCGVYVYLSAQKESNILNSLAKYCHNKIALNNFKGTINDILSEHNFNIEDVRVI